MLAVPAGVASVLCLAVLAGCGSSDNGVAAKPASQILAVVRTAAGSASSVHVVETSTIRHGGSLTLNASLAKQQAHARLSFLGANFEVIRDGDTLYLKGDPRFDARLEGVIGLKVPSGVWLKGPVAHLAPLGSFTEIDKELPIILGGSGKVSKGAKVKVAGQPAITLKQEHKLYTGTVYVATTGQPYPLQLLKQGRETGKTTFTGWNDPVTVTAPSNAVDISQLQPVKGH
jgi:hypothetical protein